MKLEFTKMHGIGNDYIYFDCFRQKVSDPAALAVRISDRHFGVGGDGVVLICPSDAADAQMRMFNQDGSEGLMCGNAIRCVGKYIYETGYARGETVTIDTRSGIKTLTLHVKDGVVLGATVDMGKAELLPAKIPVLLDGESVIGREVDIAGGRFRITCVSMGNPHCVLFVDDPQVLELDRIGPRFEHDPLFPQRVNTEFVRVIDQNTLQMRVWERGSGETLACGTGACAAVAAAVLGGFCRAGEPVRVRLRGGELDITYTEETVLMRGPAETVFTGTIEI